MDRLKCPYSGVKQLEAFRKRKTEEVVTLGKLSKLKQDLDQKQNSEEGMYQKKDKKN